MFYWKGKGQREREREKKNRKRKRKKEKLIYENGGFWLTRNRYGSIVCRYTSKTFSAVPRYLFREFPWLKILFLFLSFPFLSFISPLSFITQSHRNCEFFCASLWTNKDKDKNKKGTGSVMYVCMYLWVSSSVCHYVPDEDKRESLGRLEMSLCCCCSCCCWCNAMSCCWRSRRLEAGTHVLFTWVWQS